MKLHLIIILIIILYIFPVGSVTIPSDKNRQEISPEIKNFLSGKTIEPYAPTTIGSNDRSISISNYIPASEDPVRIEKTIIPASKNGYRVGDVICVSVEVKYAKHNVDSNEDYSKRNIKNIYIQESVDNNLDIINRSDNCYRLYTFKEISDYKNIRFENINTNKHILLDDDDILNIQTDKGVYLFNWNITPEKNNMYVEKLLNDNFDTCLVENVTIRKINDNETLCITKNNSSIIATIRKDKRNENAILTIDNITYDLKVEKNRSAPFGDLGIYDVSNYFNTWIDELKPKEEVVYWYYIKPKKAGIFKAVTIVRPWGDGYQDYPDIENPLEIEVVDPAPKFDVNLRLKELHVFQPEKVNLTYEVIYKGGRLERLDDIYVKLDDNKDYYNYVYKRNDTNDHNLSFNIGLNKNKSVKIEKYIRYDQDGEYSLPGIWINGEHYTFNEERMLVDTKWQRYHEIIALMAALFGVIIGEIYGGAICRRTTKCTIKCGSLEIAWCYLIMIVIIFIILAVSWWLFSY